MSSSQPGSRVAKCGCEDKAAGESSLSEDKEKSVLCVSCMHSGGIQMVAGRHP